MNYRIKIAWRYLGSRKSHSVVNVISAVSMVGVALTVAAMVIVLSIYNGFRAYTIGTINNQESPLSIVPAAGKVIADSDSLASAVKLIAGVASAEPIVEERALAIYGNEQSPVMLTGVPDSSSLITRLAPKTFIGEAFVGQYYESTIVMLSGPAAQKLMFAPGQGKGIDIYEPRRKGRILPSNPARAFRSDRVYVAGVYHSASDQNQTPCMVVPLSTARRLLDYTTESSRIDVDLTPGASVAKVTRLISNAIGSSYRVMTGVERHSEMFRMVNVEKWVTLLMLSFILVIAAFNILSTMAMLIAEKRSGMATLRSLGMSTRSVGSVMGWLAMLVTAVGAVSGIVVGTLITLAQQQWGLIKLQADNPDLLVIPSYPVEIQPGDIVIVAAIALAVGTAASAITSAAGRRVARQF